MASSAPRCWRSVIAGCALAVSVSSASGPSSISFELLAERGVRAIERPSRPEVATRVARHTDGLRPWPGKSPRNFIDAGNSATTARRKGVSRHHLALRAGATGCPRRPAADEEGAGRGGPDVVIVVGRPRTGPGGRRLLDARGGVRQPRPFLLLPSSRCTRSRRRRAPPRRGTPSPGIQSSVGHCHPLRVTRAAASCRISARLRALRLFLRYPGRSAGRELGEQALGELDVERRGLDDLTVGSISADVAASGEVRDLVGSACRSRPGRTKSIVTEFRSAATIGMEVDARQYASTSSI